MKIAIGCDHAGYEYKDYIKAILIEAGHEVQDFGTDGPDSVDYPDYVHPLAEAVEGSRADLGILICGSANGVCMTANKHQGIRAAIAWQTDIAALARQHNNANVVCLPARFISKHLAASIVNIFIDTSFEGGRHQRRVDKIGCV
jgi:ribose 5-phosphate isomerase B